MGTNPLGIKYLNEEIYFIYGRRTYCHMEEVLIYKSYMDFFGQEEPTIAPLNLIKWES